MLLLLAFGLTLVYMGIADRVRRHIDMLIIQGILLFGMAIIQLHHIEVVNLIFILLETLVVKAVVLPLFLLRVKQRNEISRVSTQPVSGFSKGLWMAVIIAFSFIAGHLLHESSDAIQAKYFSVGIAAILTGVMLIVKHDKILTHLMGYLVLENGIFLLTLAVGGEMPIVVNGAILLDIVMAVLVLGLIINRLSTNFGATTLEHLSELKD